MSNKASITPAVLKWARESAKMSLEVAAKKLLVTSQMLTEWENGESEPTIKQAQKLAEIYKRPFASFFLPEIPNDFQILRDFRRQNSTPLGTASTFIIREMQQKQAWVSEVNKENGEAKLDFVGKFSTKGDVLAVAHDILDTFDINPGDYRSSPMKDWVESAESQVRLKRLSARDWNVTIR